MGYVLDVEQPRGRDEVAAGRALRDLVASHRAHARRALAVDAIAVGLAGAALAALVARMGGVSIALAPAVCALAASAVLFRRLRAARTTDEAIVARIDRRLRAGQALVTLHELGGRVPLPASVVEAAAVALRDVDRRATLPAVARPSARWLAAFALATFALASFWTPRDTTTRAPGADAREVRRREVPELRALEALRSLPVADRAALERLLRDADALRRRLETGTSQQDALERLAAMQEELAGVSATETNEARRAREEAARAASAEPELAEAIASRDLARLSREVERAAARREASDRARARRALEDAALAARAAGDDALARSLEHRADLLAARAEQAELARSLAAAMPELEGIRLSRALEDLARRGDGAGLDRAMVDAMAKAWQRLDEDERRRLAEAMERAASAASRARGTPGSTAGADGGVASTPSADELEAALREALANLDRLSLSLGGNGGSGGTGLPVPVPSGGAPGTGGSPSSQASQGTSGAGQGSASGSGTGAAGSGGGGGSGGSGSGGGPGGTPTGSTARLADDPMLARVRPLTSPGGVPAASFVESVDPSTGAPLAPSAQGSTGAAAASRAGGIDRAPLPEDVRDQMRAYFGGDP